MKSIPYQHFVALLRALGLVLIRTEASHQQWDFPPGSGKKLLRTSTIRDKDKDIPMLHMHTNLSTLELSGVVTKKSLIGCWRNKRTQKRLKRPASAKTRNSASKKALANVMARAFSLNWVEGES